MSTLSLLSQLGNALNLLYANLTHEGLLSRREGVKKDGTGEKKRKRGD